MTLPLTANINGISYTPNNRALFLETVFEKTFKAEAYVEVAHNILGSAFYVLLDKRMAAKSSDELRNSEGAWIFLNISWTGFYLLICLINLPPTPTPIS